MFGFKPMITGSPVTISSDGAEPTRFDSMSKASTSTGIPYATLLYTKKNSRNQVRSNGKEYITYLITYLDNLSLVKMPHSNFKDKAYEFNSGIGKCPCGQTFEYTSERDMKMKLRMHRRFCSNPPKGFDKISVPKKAMTLGEQQLAEPERMRKVHN